MKDGFTLYRHISLAGCMPRFSPDILFVPSLVVYLLTFVNPVLYTVSGYGRLVITEQNCISKTWYSVEFRACSAMQKYLHMYFQPGIWYQDSVIDIYIAFICWENCCIPKIYSVTCHLSDSYRHNFVYFPGQSHWNVLWNMIFFISALGSVSNG